LQKARFSLTTDHIYDYDSSVLVISEGYIEANDWPVEIYVAFEIYLWGQTNKKDVRLDDRKNSIAPMSLVKLQLFYPCMYQANTLGQATTSPSMFFKHAKRLKKIKALSGTRIR
jgi:hypothetical protein